MSDQPDGSDSVAAGIALTFVLHMLASGTILWLALVSELRHMLAYPALGLVLLLGVTQLIYMIPAVLIARRQGRTHLAKGLSIGAAVTFMVNAACWTLVNLQGLLSALRSIFPFWQ